MSRQDPGTVRELIAASYAMVAAAHRALVDGRSRYGRLDHMIAARLYKGLVTGTMSMRSLYDDERLKMTMPQACCYCASTDSLVLDHLIPRVKGGPDQADNLVWACKKCNGSKSGHDMMTWMRKRGAFPPILLLRRYLKIVSRDCVEAGCMDRELANFDGAALPFDLGCLPTDFPQPGELVLWVYPQD